MDILKVTSKKLIAASAMDNPELYEKTKKLLRDLNHFLVHVIVYFVCNATITYFTFRNLEQRWWMFSLVVAWAFGLIYHALKVYGVNENKRLNRMWLWV